MDSEWHEFTAYLASLTDTQWQVKVNDHWNVKDVVAHLVGWAYEVADALPVVWATGNEPWFCETEDYDAFNDANVLKYSHLSPQKLLREYLRSEEIVQHEIDSVGESRLREARTYGWVFDDGPNSHLLRHFHQIRKALENTE